MRTNLRKRPSIIEVRDCIGRFLHDYYKRTRREGWHLVQGACYWSERDIQCRLFSYLQERIDADWIHAEGNAGRLKGHRRGQKVDLVVANPEYENWYENCVSEMQNTKRRLAHRPEPKSIAMIELKLIWRGLLPTNQNWTWSGYNYRNTEELVKNDLSKLAQCLCKKDDVQLGKTEEAHLILLDFPQDRGLRSGIEVEDPSNLYYSESGRDPAELIARLFNNASRYLRGHPRFWPHLLLWHCPDPHNCVGYYEISDWSRKLPRIKFRSFRA